jgi:hypothetical protein
VIADRSLQNYIHSSASIPRRFSRYIGGRMQTRELEHPSQASSTPDLVFRTPVNWTYVVFFACLGLLHLIIATLAFLHGRWEAYMSVALGATFVGVAIVAWRCRFEMTIQAKERRIRLRSGMRRMHYQRFISFADVHGIRLTLLHPSDAPNSRIEVLCDNEDIECPPTSIPRQEALCLAMLMGVRLIKVCDEDDSAGLPSNRLN